MTFNKNKLGRICAGLLAGGMVTFAAPALVMAATAAGTLIKNLATVTYEDASGNQYSAQSNEAVITVKQVYSADIGTDATKTAAAGQMVYIQHTLTNTGNGTDTYALSATNDGTISDQLDSSNIKIYLDSNGNGLADPGEQEISSVTLAAGQSAEVVIAVAVPTTATPGDTLGVILNATTANGTVNDTTTGNGTDAAEGTNQSLITVSNNAVLNYTKSAVLDSANSQITYTLTISNTGNQAASSIKIYDALPAGTTLVSATAQGLLTSNGDTLPAAATLDETAIGIDLNGDGDMTDSSLSGIEAFDASIASGQTVSITMVADYDPATFNNNSTPGSAGDIIKNTAWLEADLDGNPATTEDPIPSNSTQTTLPQGYGAGTSDTGVGAGAGTNNGGDDDGVNGAGTDDIQTVDTAPSGSTVLFQVILTNTGSGADTLDLAINPGDFPPGTTFTFWNSTGTVQLTDTNGENGVDSGLLQAGQSTTIMVKAHLPAGSTDANSDPGADGYTATVTATSSKDPSTTPASDSTSLVLNGIGDPGVDIKDAAAGSSAAALGTLEDQLGTTPYNINNGSDPGARAAYAGTVGGTVTIPFYIDNNAGASDAFQLSAGSSWDGTNMGSLPAGWTVKFYKGDGSGNPTGSALNSTELMPGGAFDREYVAVVTISSDPANALADYGTMDANADGDGDQPVFIRIRSTNSGASDIMVDAIDVTSLRDVTLTPPGSNQIQPGGSVNYIHTLDNTGNTEETFELTSTDSNTTNGWSSTVMVDTNGDGVPDTTFGQLQPGDKIYGTDAAGNPVEVTWADADGDKNPEVTLPPGVSLPLMPTVYSPSDAAAGTTNITTITATNTDPAATAPDTSIQDVSTVILGQVRLTKTVAYDAACDGTADGAFAANLTTQVAPNECAIWQIVAENQGDANALNVIIRDNVPAYTSYEAGSLKYALGTVSGANPLATQTDGAGDDSGENVGGDIAFFVGTGATPSAGGTLLPGQSATVHFSTKVN